MLAINKNGHLVTQDNTKKEITVVGLIFHEQVYRDACRKYADTGVKVKIDDLISYQIAPVRL